jgi:hypothetical protein
METNDFFKQDQEQWFLELREAEFQENLTNTNTQDKNFIFEDIPF